jgi:hypothetical protein
MTSDIQDDWEEVQPMLERNSMDSEVASVHSINDSEDFSLDETSPPTSPAQEDLCRAYPNPPSYAVASGRASAPDSTNTHPPAHDSTTTKTTREEATQNDDAASIHSAETNAEDLLDIDVEPPILLSSITSIIATLVETISFSSDLSTARSDDFYLPNILSECHTLFKLLSELERVVSCYADSWRPDASESDAVPLDPALYKWTSDFMISLLGLQAAVQREIDMPGGSSDDFSTELVQYLSPLIESREMMENFLPIIKVYITLIESNKHSNNKTTVTSTSSRLVKSAFPPNNANPRHQDKFTVSTPIPTLSPKARFPISADPFMR